MVDLNSYRVNFEGFEDYLREVEIKRFRDDRPEFTFIFMVDDFKLILHEYPKVDDDCAGYNLVIYQDVAAPYEEVPDWKNISNNYHLETPDRLLEILSKFKEHEMFIKSLATIPGC